MPQVKKTPLQTLFDATLALVRCEAYATLKALLAANPDATQQEVMRSCDHIVANYEAFCKECQQGAFDLCNFDEESATHSYMAQFANAQLQVKNNDSVLAMWGAELVRRFGVDEATEMIATTVEELKLVSVELELAHLHTAARAAEQR